MGRAPADESLPSPVVCHTKSGLARAQLQRSRWEASALAAMGGGKTAFTTPTANNQPGAKNTNLGSAIRIGNEPCDSVMP